MKEDRTCHGDPHHSPARRDKDGARLQLSVIRYQYRPRNKKKETNMSINKTVWRLGLALVLTAGISGRAKAADPVQPEGRRGNGAGALQQVVLLDECDPATFNDAFGPGTCTNVVGAVGVKLPDFLKALPTGHPDWLFYPTHIRIKQGDTLRAVNQGGEIHTFTEVKEFGGGFIPVLNNPPNSPSVPECGSGYVNNPAMASTRVIQGSSLLVTDLKRGVHHFECCVHPWMRMDVEVK